MVSHPHTKSGMHAKTIYAVHEVYLLFVKKPIKVICQSVDSKYDL